MQKHVARMAVHRMHATLDTSQISCRSFKVHMSRTRSPTYLLLSCDNHYDGRGTPNMLKSAVQSWRLLQLLPQAWQKVMLEVMSCWLVVR